MGAGEGELADALSRRRFLQRGAALGGTALLAGPLAACGELKGTSSGPKVVVVGAGLAGLTAAYGLHRGGAEVSLYEAHPDRVGGRCWSAREFDEGQVGEHGGELLDRDHTRMRALVRELGLTLEDRAAYYRRRSGRYSVLNVNGAIRDQDDVFRGYPAVRRRLRSQAQWIGWTGGDYHYRRDLAFDRRTAADWIARYVPGGGDSLLGQALREYLASEFGADAERLGADNLLYLADSGNSALEYGGVDTSYERYHVHGGNDQVPNGIARRLPEGMLHMDVPLEAVWRRGDGSYGMRFRGAGGDVLADRVVLAIPFTTLRDVDLGGAGLSRLKREAIAKLGMGTNAKLLMQFRHRPDHYGRWNGYAALRPPGIETWDTSLTQAGDDGLITVFSGGSVGAGYGIDQAHGPAPEAVVRDTLAELDRVVPGISGDFNGLAWLDYWAVDPWVHGSYAAFGPGQTARYTGVIKRPEGGIHFAGEHTSVAYQGYLEGAVRSGERVIREIQA